MNILYNSVKSGGSKDNFRQVKVPGTAPYWKAWGQVWLYIMNKKKDTTLY